jgi:hypothetical protein
MLNSLKIYTYLIILRRQSFRCFGCKSFLDRSKKLFDSKVSEGWTHEATFNFGDFATGFSHRRGA